MKSGNSGKPSGDNAATELAKLARQALEEKRFRDCLALTAAILKIDPNHREANVIETWVHKDLEQQLAFATKLIDTARQQNNRNMWQEADISVRRILHADPDHPGAKSLLSEILSRNDFPAWAHAARADAPRPFHMGPTAEKPWFRWTTVLAAAAALGMLLLLIAGFAGLRNLQQPPVSETAPTTVNSPLQGTLTVRVDDGVRVFVDGEFRGTSPLAPLQLVVGKHQLRYETDGQTIGEEEIEIVHDGITANRLERLVARLDLVTVPVEGVQLTVDDMPMDPAPAFLLLKPGLHVLSFRAAGRQSEMLTIRLEAGERRLIPVLLQEAGDPRENVLDTASTSPRPAAASSSKVASPLLGKLSVTSAVPTEIYIDGQLLGSTPATLEIPAGEQVVEYRTEQLRQTMTYLIKRGETTVTNVVFNTTVQINASPWAEVLLEGERIVSLGQTPLSNVRLPVGSILIFRNPRFPEKTYRVTAKDAAIQVTLQ